MKKQYHIFATTFFALVSFALAPLAQAVAPPPDGGYPGGNTAEGTSALFSLTTGLYNTGIGIYSLLSLTDGNFCTGVGAGALLVNTAGSNTATGAGALLSNTTGDQNTANGTFALFSNTEGVQNTATGAQALQSNTTGSFNVANGYQALLSNIDGNYNTASGLQALFHDTSGSNNVAIGPGALFFNTTGNQNTAIGAGFVLYNNDTGNLNTAIGDFALANNVAGSNNTAIGASALFTNTVDGNTAIGAQALANNTSGSFNTADGASALQNNTMDGSNTALGVNAGTGVTTANNVIVIGTNLAGANLDNSCYIGSIFGQPIDPATAIAVGIDASGKLGTTVSSRRFKHDIKPMAEASEAILALKPVTFHYKNDAKGTPQFGLIAEEVAQVNPDLAVHDKNGEILSVHYDQINAMLLNEFLKEHQAFLEQQCKVERQDGRIQEQEAIIAQLTKQMETVVARLK